jgi:hypothetical protein
MTDEQVRAFLVELTALCRKHGLAIEGWKDDPPWLTRIPRNSARVYTVQRFTERQPDDDETPEWQDLRLQTPADIVSDRDRFEFDFDGVDAAFIIGTPDGQPPA